MLYHNPGIQDKNDYMSAKFPFGLLKFMLCHKGISLLWQWFILRDFLGELSRAVASLTVLGGQELHFPHFFLKFWSIYLIFPQTLLIFFLILVLRVGGSPTREGPGYATGIE